MNNPNSRDGRASNYGSRDSDVPGIGQGTASNAPTSIPPGTGPINRAVVGSQFLPRMPFLAYGEAAHGVVGKVRRLIRGR